MKNRNDISQKQKKKASIHEIQANQIK